MTSMFMRVNSKCAHQVRPPLKTFSGFAGGVGPAGRWSTGARGQSVDQGRVGRERSQKVRDLLERRVKDVDAKLAKSNRFDEHTLFTRLTE